MSSVSKKITPWIIVLLILLPCCKTPVQDQQHENDRFEERSLLETNRYMRDRHRQHIMAFIQRAGWKMTETPTGLWYMILEPGSGQPVVPNHRIAYTFQTRLLNGEVCYSAGRDAPREIVAGKGDIEAGLQEGLLLLREGSMARFIMPPYLAHGNFGDGNRIPGSSILLTEVEVISVKR